MNMSYRIRYGQSEEKEIISDKNTAPAGKRALRVLAVLSAVLILLYCIGVARLSEFLFPGDREVTQSALTAFASDIQNGKKIGTAWRNFCKEIISGAKVA